jgi:hypothetical protein
MNLKSRTTHFRKELKHFICELDFMDRKWGIIFPSKNIWHHINVTKYKESFYISLLDGKLETLEIKEGNEIQTAPSFGSSPFGQNNEPSPCWDDLIAAATRWLAFVKKDWIMANRQAHAEYPVSRRKGIVPNALVRTLLKDIYRIDKELGKAKVKKFVNIVESGYFLDEKNTTRKSMRAADFFDYCKIAYEAGKRKDDYVDLSLTGRQMYEQYADGRHEGLLEIDVKSPQEFADWIDGKHPKKKMGGHPWEIKRGGNTTHINLSVHRHRYNKGGFTITLTGASIGRLKETICMFLAIYDAKLPITISDPEGIRKRLLAQDNIGIVPCYDSLHRANQSFHEHEGVYDVIYYDDLGRSKVRVKPFIAWEPLPILRPL